MSKFTRFLAGRLIKVVGNALKGVCYLFHYVYPNKRFMIPGCAEPWLRSGSGPAIPRAVWQTNYTDRVTLPVYLNYLFNRLISPTYRFRLVGGLEMAEFIERHYAPRVFDCYSRLQIGAAQADLWRLLVLHKFGGVYLDIDAHMVWPLERVIKPDCRELYLIDRNGRLTNYFLASASDNPNLDLVIEAVLRNIENKTTGRVYYLTGPGAMTQALDGLDLTTADYRYTCYQGTFTNEYFQYVDHPQGKWTRAQRFIDPVRADDAGGDLRGRE
jgi:mannosyltransferase OCH1-like enzyme